MGDILFLAHRIPFPPDRGDKIRAYNVLKFLAKRKRVHLAAFVDDTRDLKRKNSPLEKITGNRALIWRSKSQATAAFEAVTSGKPASLTAFDSQPMHDAVQNLLTRHSIDAIYVFSSQMAQYVPARGRQRVIMDFVDMDSAKFAAYGKSSGGLRGWFYRREAKKLFQFERSAAQRADFSLFVSEQEADLFRSRSQAGNVQVLENGIDAEMFSPAAQYKRVETTGDMIVFTGQMDYRPNVEGVVWFVETVFPHIRVRNPNARFAIVGRNPTPQVLALEKHDGVTVTGEVADVRGWLAAASVVVAPLRLARGIQNKVLEAMAMARPVVASTAAAEGIDHQGTIRVGAQVGEIADHVIELLANPRVAAELGRAARARVLDRYSWDACLAPLDAILGPQGRIPYRPRTGP